MYSISTPNLYPMHLFSTFQNPSNYASLQFQRVLEASGYCEQIGLYSSFAVKNNAMAISKPVYELFQPNVLSHYERYIIYDLNFMKDMEFRSGNKFVTLSIFAHELGHHFYRHTDFANPWNIFIHPHDKECLAEYYSGFVLAKLGAKPADLEAAQRLFFTMRSSDTHPDSFNRISWIVRGWRYGGGVGNVADSLPSIYAKIMEELKRWD